MSEHAVELQDADWSRDRWLQYADRLLDAARAHASENNARIVFPGAEGGYGRAVDGLEGFARTFLLAGFRLVGANGEGLDDLADFYRRGVTAGVDPEAPDRWVRLEEHAQAKVEAASLALILDMTRPWIWDRLDELTRGRVIDYLAPVVGDDTYPKTNWLWFRVVVQTFLRSVGGTWSAEDIADDLALHDALVREDGWMSDGFERSFDHYVGWALHLYPVLWSRMHGASDLAAGRTDADIAALDRYLQDAVALVGADGSPLLQGRSLIYRFAAAAPFWVGAIAGVPSVSLGRLRVAAGSIVSHFADHGAPDDDGLLSIGWWHPWRALAQSYSGPGSPYWAVKGLLGVALPADHPVWSAPAEVLPVTERDGIRAIRAAGWVVSSTRADGIVRIANHGTDHAPAGALTGDSPLYARIGYSTATSPLADEAAWEEPLEQSVALVDAAGRATHRTAMDLLDVRVDAEDTEVGVASSTWPAHWIDARPSAQRHGSGLEGEVTTVARLTVHSLVRGPWELRLVRVDEVREGIDPASLRLRVGGWPVAADEVDHEASGDAAQVAASGVRSSTRLLLGEGSAAVARRADASPLGPDARVPLVELQVVPGEWSATLLELTGALVGDSVPTVRVVDADALIVHAQWPDGTSTRTVLTNSGRSTARAGIPMEPDGGLLQSQRSSTT
ncbi:DUF2264 domain-containing protein [Microbacterium sp. P05]|uniref:DUF2264 domain-containing protein n=1 Tax=Microbacterium sp. P05 TaxID=3366948 RepID=UPI0037453ADD